MPALAEDGDGLHQLAIRIGAEGDGRQRDAGLGHALDEAAEVFARFRQPVR